MSFVVSETKIDEVAASHEVATNIANSWGTKGSPLCAYKIEVGIRKAALS